MKPICPAHNFVVGPASGIVLYEDLVFHPFVRSHLGTILLKALDGGISVLWTHFFSSSIFTWLLRWQRILETPQQCFYGTKGSLECLLFDGA